MTTISFFCPLADFSEKVSYSIQTSVSLWFPNTPKKEGPTRLPLFLASSPIPSLPRLLLSGPGNEVSRGGAGAEERQEGRGITLCPLQNRPRAVYGEDWMDEEPKELLSFGLPRRRSRGGCCCIESGCTPMLSQKIEGTVVYLPT